MPRSSVESHFRLCQGVNNTLVRVNDLTTADFFVRNAFTQLVVRELQQLFAHFEAALEKPLCKVISKDRLHVQDAQPVWDIFADFCDRLAKKVLRRVSNSQEIDAHGMLVDGRPVSDG